MLAWRSKKLDTETATELLARRLYEAMEELETIEPPGEPWDELPEVYKPWYRDCVTVLLADQDGLQAAKALATSRRRHDILENRPSGRKA